MDVQQPRPRRTLSLYVRLWLLVVSLPLPAQAGWTHPVAGLEEALHLAWANHETCRGLQIDDVVVRQGGLHVITDKAGIVRLSTHPLHEATCTVQGSGVAIQNDDLVTPRQCALAICNALEQAPALVRQLAPPTEHADSLAEEAPAPLPWTAPVISIDAAVLMGECIATLLLFAAFLVARFKNPMSSPTPQIHRRDWWLLLAIAAVALSLRASIALLLPIEFDETISVGYDSLWREFEGREVLMNPPLYRVLAYPLAWLSGGTVLWGRTVPVLLGACAVVIMAKIADIVAGRRAALAAAAAAMAHPGWIIATVYHRTYALWITVAALALLFCILALRGRHWVDRYLVATCLAACVMSHYFGVGVVVALGLWVAWVDARSWRQWVGPTALLILLCVPYVPATLGGAGMKASIAPQEMMTIGVPRALAIASALPSVAAGLVRPSLQNLVNVDHPGWRLLLHAVVLVLMACLGSRYLRRQDCGGLVLFTLIAGAVPVIAATRLTTVRELHGIVAAVPLVLLFSAAARCRAGAMLLVVAVPVYLLTLVWGPPPLLPETLPDPDAATLSIQNDTSQWPVFIWPADTRGYRPIALRLGMKRRDLDASTQGLDERARPLRSCSTAAVREASLASQRREVRVYLVEDTCRPQDLDGRGVECGLAHRIAGHVVATTCRVDVGTARAFPLRLPIARSERAIVAGHEKEFASAAAGAGLKKDSADGVVLDGIGIGASEVSYELLSPREGNARARIVMSPRFLGEDVVATDVRTLPEGSLPPRLSAAARQLSAELVLTFTPQSWDTVFGSTGRDKGTINLHLQWTLGLMLAAAAVFLRSLLHDYRQELRAAGDHVAT